MNQIEVSIKFHGKHGRQRSEKTQLVTIKTIDTEAGSLHDLAPEEIQQIAEKAFSEMKDVKLSNAAAMCFVFVRHFEVRDGMRRTALVGKESNRSFKVLLGHETITDGFGNKSTVFNGNNQFVEVV